MTDGSTCVGCIRLNCAISRNTEEGSLQCTPPRDEVVAVEVAEVENDGLVLASRGIVYVLEGVVKVL